MQILALATEEQRILITEDHDYGVLAVHEGRGHAGVILLRVERLSAMTQGKRVVAAVREIGAALATSFIVVEPDRVRRSE